MGRSNIIERQMFSVKNIAVKKAKIVVEKAKILV